MVILVLSSIKQYHIEVCQFPIPFLANFKLIIWMRPYDLICRKFPRQIICSIPCNTSHVLMSTQYSPSRGRKVDSSRFLEMLNRELLWRFSFLISGATQLIGLVSGVTGGVDPVALVLLGGLLLLLLLVLLVLVFDVKACNGTKQTQYCYSL